MTKADKRLLMALVKEGKSFTEIKKYLSCSDATIKKYIKWFGPGKNI